MELETLFTLSKWEILRYLSRGKFSPLELSKKLNTTIANISQQLRLLEFAGLVKKEKVSARDAGKPRTLYFLSEDFSHLILVMDGFADKRLLSLTDHHKFLFRIWFIDDASLHYYLEKFYWKIEHLMDNISAVLVDTNSTNPLIYIVSEMKDIDKKIQDTVLKDRFGNEKKILVKTLKEKDIAAKLPQEKVGELHIIHDPQKLFRVHKG